MWNIKNLIYKDRIYIKKLWTYIKRKKIEFSITMARWAYVWPIVTLYFIILAIIIIVICGIILAFIDIFSPNDLSKIISEDVTSNIKKMTGVLLLYFFIMLGIVDLSILVLDRYVYKHISKTMEEFDKSLSSGRFEEFDKSLSSGRFEDDRRDFIDKKAKCPEHSKSYPEKVLVFGVIFILLEIFSKLFGDATPDYKLLLVGISMVLISIGIWKYLSFKSDKNSDFEAMIFSKR